ncbi:(2Fe-2S)-binding protein [Sporosalibacterium faouarense]|uniref:(2Fe-2S)-binding protein n=1 Tax=Sporosalibacterium faouarense TaxID=516123 RepID=UPI00141C73B2|nr:(2Fe-2S)-binding protein [Sporosalibacterium faouarense]MTI48070.1 (2Fe-2S)-binding protein [Bacillota bacterium]
MDNNTIICRCSDLSLQDIRDLINDGYTSLEEIKRISRAGMGPCQGRTCSQLILREISRITGKDIHDLQPCTNRPPTMGIKLKTIADGRESND